MKRLLILVGIFCTAVSASTVLYPEAVAAQVISGPQTMVYNGHLLNASGDAVTTSHSIRFSYWNTADYVTGDLTATGAIEVSASGYAGWQEVHTVTPNAQGYFTVYLGSGTSLPDFSSMNASTLASLHLQVEVKVESSADTAYELLDANGSNDSIDRSPVLSVPFALNADMVDQRHVGTSSGSLPVLQTGGILDASTIPGGTASGVFVIDVDNTEAGDITLQFGGSLLKQLEYQQVNNYFNFNDDVNIQGDLTVSGLINGVDITSLTGGGTGTHLRVASGGGLNVNVLGGSYRVSGDITNFTGDSGIALEDNSTNYVFMTSTGTQINTVGFPTNHSYIPLAEVITENGGVRTVDDRRVFQSDDREHSTEIVLNPEFENVAMQGDASNNVGRLFVSHDSINLKNFYVWTSTITSIQDYDIILKVSLPESFLGWNDNPVTVSYRSTSADTANNKMDISLFDTNGTPVTLSGSTTDLANTSWTTSGIEYSGTPTWTAGQDFLVKFKLYAKDDYQMQLGTVRFDFRELE